MKLTLTEITRSRLRAEIEAYMTAEYARSGRSYGVSSPYGQILEAQMSISELNSLYVKNATKMWDVNDPATARLKPMRSLARLAGYDPSRARSAKGVIVLKPKVGVDVATELPGATVTVNNKLLIKNNSNGLDYSVNIGSDSATFAVTSGSVIELPIIQGKWETFTFTGTGRKSQSFAIPSGGRDVEQNNYEVFYNSQILDQSRSLLDMLPNAMQFYARTGIDSALDIYFGNGDSGFIPALGSVIDVSCLRSNGAAGNIRNPRTGDFTFIDDFTDAYGGSVDVSSIFEISIKHDTRVGFGADAETAEDIAANLPNMHTGEIARPEHVEFHFRRMGVFSVVQAYRDKSDRGALADLTKLLKQNTDLLTKELASPTSDPSIRSLIRANIDQVQRTRSVAGALGRTDVVSVMLVPDVQRFYGNVSGVDYFDVPESYFTLSTTDMLRMETELVESGNLSVTMEVKVVAPTVRKFVAVISARLFDDADEGSVRAEMRSKIAEYMTNNNRRDRIPPSDIIKIVEEIDGIDSADVSFLSKQNEEYHWEFETKRAAFYTANSREPAAGEIIMSDGRPYDPAVSYGIDTVLGDATFADGELPMLRGDWSDRNGNKYTGGFGNGLSAVTILFVNPKSKRPRKRGR